MANAVGMGRDAEVGTDHHAAATGGLDAEGLGDRAGPHAGRPDQGVGGQLLAGREMDARRRHPGDGLAGAHLDAAGLERGAGVGAAAAAERR